MRNDATSGPADLEALASKKPENPQPIPAARPHTIASKSVRITQAYNIAVLVCYNFEKQ